MALIEDINEQNIELEEIDLEKVEDQEKAADEKYNNFEADQLRLDPDGWGKKIRSRGSRLDTTLTVPVGEREDNMLSKLDKTYQKNNNAPVQSNNGSQPDGEKRTLSQTGGPDGQITSRLGEGDLQEEGQDYTQRMEVKMDKLRMRWAGSDYEILLEKIEMLKS